MFIFQAAAGGVGKVMAEWIVDGQPEWDVWPLHLRRFGRQYSSQAYTLARSYEALSQYYDIKYPGEEKQAGRPLRVSPVYQRHRELQAAFGERTVGLQVRGLANVNARGRCRRQREIETS